ncbi:MAG: adenylate/guanylate cyclase domain-containing protein [Spirochaetia bacterium]|jgi:predicted ATPase/class 3 adenylate cyclase/tetratricopeptide (TPR) repeat protein
MENVRGTIPSGTVTFLFTDIEGSTKLWDTRKDEMSRAVARHDAIMRETIEAHSGYVFKTVGDAFCASFAGAAQGLDAALEIRRRLGAVDWGQCPVRVRIGLHSGLAYERDGDYFGQPLNRTARLSSAGSGGQILISSAVKELLVDALPAGVTLKELGVHRLKDLASPERIWQVDEQGSAVEFPPIRTLDSRPNNLPLLLTPFIGREKERVEVGTLLESARLLTLFGPGGSGKTRLALECAAGALDLHTDGVWFVDLSVCSSGGEVMQAVGGSLGIRTDRSRTTEESLLTRLRDADTLIVLDNCEHVVDACARLAERLLSGCGGVRILATSRESLLVSGEVTYLLKPMDVPIHGDKAWTPEGLTQFEAVRLFIDRAVSVRRDFRVDEATAPFIADICSRLDGIPLGIELAAAQLRYMTIRDLSEKLKVSFSFLKSGSRAAVQRQSTLSALLDWSWKLVSDDERNAWQAASLFRGSFSRAALESVAGSSVAAALEGLLLKSVIRLSGDPARESRFAMLDIVRMYGLERLRAGGSYLPVLTYFLEWASVASRRFALENTCTLMRAECADLEQDLPSLGEAITLGLQEDTLVQRSADVFVSLLDYLWSGRSSLEQSAVLHGRVSARRSELDERSRAALQGWEVREKLWRTRRPEELFSAIDDAVTAAQRAGDYYLEASLIGVQFTVRLIANDFGAAIRQAVELLAFARAHRMVHRQCEALSAIALCILASAHMGKDLHPSEFWIILPPDMDLGDPPATSRAAAIRCWEACLAFAEKIGNLQMKAEALIGLGDSCSEERAWERARSSYTDAINVSRLIGHPLNELQARRGLGVVESMMGNYEGAVALLGESLGLCRTIGDYPNLMETTLEILEAQIRAERWVEALATALHAAGTVEVGSVWEDAILRRLALCQVRMSLLADAEKTLRQVIKVRRALKERLRRISAWVTVMLATILTVRHPGSPLPAVAAGYAMAIYQAELSPSKEPGGNSMAGWQWPAELGWGSPDRIDWSQAVSEGTGLRKLLLAIDGSYIDPDRAVQINKGRDMDGDALDDQLLAALDVG